MTRKLLHSIARLYTCDGDDRVLDDAFVVVEDGRIAALGVGRPEGRFDVEEDLSGCIVLPGLVNLHHHYFQTLTRAVPAALGGHLVDWLGRMYPIWAGMTADDMAVATDASVAQLLLTGATTSVDHAYLLPDDHNEVEEAGIAAARAMGQRTVFVRGSMTALEADLEARLTPVLGERAGGLKDRPDAALARMRAALDAHHDRSHGAMTSIALGPTTTTYDDPDFMRGVADLAADADCKIHIHFHPRPDERELLAPSGRTPMDFLEQVGWLTHRTFFAHSTRLSEDDMARAGDAGLGIAHCPRMILRLGARVPPIHDYLKAGIKIGVGVDGGASNDSGSMLGEMRVAQLLHRVAGGEGDVPWQDWLSPYRLLCMATRDAAAVLGRSDIGHLAPGMCADITAFDMRSVAYAGARTDLLAGLLLTGDDDRAALTMVAGEVLVRNKALVGRDERGIRQAVDCATARLLERAAGLTGIDYGQVA